MNTPTKEMFHVSDLNTIQMNIEGLDDLIDSLENLTKKYPDEAGELLRADALKLRKDIVLSARDKTNTKSQSKKSLGRAGSYRVSRVQGYGIRQYVEVTAKAPHFHLVEHGHVQLNKNGEAIGFVPGRHFMEPVVNKFEDEVPVHAEKMVGELLKKEGFE